MSNIIVTTVFKSGTKLLENLIESITGLSPISPPHSASPDYINPKINLGEDGFFIWHSRVTNEFLSIGGDHVAKRIYLVRNIYDLLVSQYYHFSLDIDSEIDCSTSSSGYFQSLTREAGVSLVINGASSPRFHWEGFGPQLTHTQECVKASNYPNSLLVIYDRLVKDKKSEVLRLARFLGYRLETEVLAEIVRRSSIEGQRSEREKRVGRALHFRQGKPGSWRDVLCPYHIDMISLLKLQCASELDDLCRDKEIGDIVAGY